MARRNDYFRFKKFTIKQDKCAMKVGTDGVLLGSWVSIRKCRAILDVGTGTGLIALMLAQRSEASIDAIDIDKEAVLQAGENISTSPFAGRIRTFHASFDEFVSAPAGTYDLIVSNPPYFNQSLKNPDDKRATARHTDSFSYASLIRKGKALLHPEGRLAFILPSDQEKELLETIRQNDMHLTRRTDIFPTPTSLPKRILVEVSPDSLSHPVHDSLTIEVGRHEYTAAFQALTKEFYL